MTVTTQTVASTPLYEYWIVARKIDANDGSYSVLRLNEVGHAFTAIIRKKQKVTKTFNNGTLVSTSAPFDDGNWEVFHTYGYWPTTILPLIGGSVKLDNGCDQSAQNNECGNVKNILAGNSISLGGQAVRKSRISESRANYIQANQNTYNCNAYDVNGQFIGSNGPCNCVTYAALQWYTFTANQDNFIPLWPNTSSPNYLVDLINSKNQSTGNQFIDNGNTWQ